MITPCDVCGNVDLNWDRGWAVSDEEWRQVVPERWRDATLCPWCFVKFAAERGKRYKVAYYPWDPEISMGVKKVEGERRMTLDDMRRELREKYERLSRNLEFKVKETPGLTKYKPYAQKLVWMPPERFLEVVPEPLMWSEDSLRYLKDAMLRGEELEPLWVDVFSHTCQVWKHEGRHRARAAMELGIKKVPVITYCLSPQGGFVDYSECEPCDTERLKRWLPNPVEERRLPLDGDVWRAIREQGLGLDSVGAYWVYEDGVGYVLLKFKPGIKEEYIQRVASAVRELGYNVRVRRGVARRNPLGEHKGLQPEAVKRYTLWIERLEKVGLRDPEDPFKMIPPSDPRTRREIERLKIDLAYAKGEIDLDEYYKRYERLREAK